METEKKGDSCPFSIWKTIKLGLCRTRDEYRSALEKAGNDLEWTNMKKLIDQVICAQEEIEVDLVKITVAELGFEKRIPYQYVFARAERLGLFLCPAEVGPALCLCIENTPEDENIEIAMEVDTKDAAGAGYIFAIRNGNMLDYSHVNFYLPMELNDFLVFIKPR